MPAKKTTPVDMSDIRQSVAFHTQLNHKLWDKSVIRKDVRVALLEVAHQFIEFVNDENLVIKDVIFTGSNAGFNYTKYSDLDVHIIVDFDKSTCPKLADNFFNTKRMFWNTTHDIDIKGYAVELYVEDIKNPVTAVGVFSLLHNKWIKKPVHQKPEWNDSSVYAKVKDLAETIDALLDSDPDKNDVDNIFAKLTSMRKSGLAKNGEFSVENLAFKTLRNLGLLDRLHKVRLQSQDRELSLEHAPI